MDTLYQKILSEFQAPHWKSFWYLLRIFCKRHTLPGKMTELMHSFWTVSPHFAMIFYFFAKTWSLWAGCLLPFSFSFILGDFFFSSFFFFLLQNYNGDVSNNVFPGVVLQLLRLMVYKNSILIGFDSIIKCYGYSC